MSDTQEPIEDLPPAWANDARQMHGLDPIQPTAKPAPDSSDPAVIKAAQRAARLDARKLAATVGEMMKVPEVRTWMYRLLERYRAFTLHDFPTSLPLDPLQLARHAAHREVSQFVTADIMAACPDLYVLMLKENA